MTVSVRRPRAIVFDILGTASKSGFLERILFPFLKGNLENYVNSHWARKEFKVLYKRIMEQSADYNKQEPATPVVLAYDQPGSKQSLLAFINFVTDNGINSPSVTHLRFKVWFEGYQQEKLRTPIYSDVPNQVKKWFAEGVKFFVFSNTWVEAQKALLKNTNHGDLTNLISGHFDNDFGSITETESWRRLCSNIKEKPENVLFLTKSPAEAKVASEAGLGVVLVLTHRHNVKAVSHEDRQRFPYVRTLNDLQWAESSMMPASSQAAEGAPASTSGGGALPSNSGAASPMQTAMSVSEATKPLMASGAPSATSSQSAMAKSQHSTSGRKSSATGAPASSSRHSSSQVPAGEASASTPTSSTAGSVAAVSSSSHK